MLRAAPGVREMRPAHHLVDGRSGDVEMATHVGFCRGPFEYPAIGVDEGQVLALGLRKAGSRRRYAFVK
jgi:hypothetical protein